MRTMILLIVLFGTFPDWMSTVGIIWYGAACVRWWYKVYQFKGTVLVELVT